MEPLEEFIEFVQRTRKSTLTPTQLIVAKSIFETKAGQRMFVGQDGGGSVGIGKTFLLTALEDFAHKVTSDRTPKPRVEAPENPHIDPEYAKRLDEGKPKEERAKNPHPVGSPEWMKFELER